ncbi:uncharacterized protein DFL_007920 [Arthrobotrys flagrans]|uniref:Uncharacterized protein n=1 Tax=Arthrobotrys flagrans TaxID=97331 RepID=A0A436ZX29_ARTFL|nr:hypothetical protein DFL_007920 [Arthrobotrys flagrans]
MKHKVYLTPIPIPATSTSYSPRPSPSSSPPRPTPHAPLLFNRNPKLILMKNLRTISKYSSSTSFSPSPIATTTPQYLHSTLVTNLANFPFSAPNGQIFIIIPSTQAAKSQNPLIPFSHSAPLIS